MRSKWYSLLLVGLALVLATSVMACAPAVTPTPTPKQTESLQYLQILSHGIRTTREGNLLVEGTAKNVSSSTLRFATVFAKFYDASGSLLGTSLAATTDLVSGDTWSFKMIYSKYVSRVASYEVGVGLTRP